MALDGIDNAASYFDILIHELSISNNLILKQRDIKSYTNFLDKEVFIDYLLFREQDNVFPLFQLDKKQGKVIFFENKKAYFKFMSQYPKYRTKHIDFAEIYYSKIAILTHNMEFLYKQLIHVL